MAYFITASTTPNIRLKLDPTTNNGCTLETGYRVQIGQNFSMSVQGNIGIQSGRAYFEAQYVSGTNPYVGIGNGTMGAIYFALSSSGRLYLNDIPTDIGKVFSQGDVIGVDVDRTTNVIAWYKNGVVYHSASIPASFQAYDALYPRLGSGDTAGYPKIELNGGWKSLNIPAGSRSWGYYATKTSPTAMVIGDRISCEIVGDYAGSLTFSNLGSVTKPKLPQPAVTTSNGSFDLIHIGYDLSGNVKLLADRTILFCSRNYLNSMGFVQGRSISIGNTDVTVRCPTGGTYNDAYFYDALNNEWNAAVVDLNAPVYTVGGIDQSEWLFSTDFSWMSSDYDAQTTCTQGTVRADTSLARSSYGSLDSNIGFRPMFVLNGERIVYLLLKGSEYFTVNGTVIESIGATPPDLNTFLAKGMVSITDIPEPIGYTLIACLTKEGYAKNSINAGYADYPATSLFKPKTLFTLSQGESLLRFDVPQTTVKFLYTPDLVTYYKYNGNTLVSASIENAADFMDYATINSIPTSLLGSSFAIAMLTPASSTFSLSDVSVEIKGELSYSIEIAGNEVSPLSTNSERTIPITSIPLGTSDMVLKAGDVTATVPITREAIARQSVKRSIKSYEGGYQGTAPVSNVEIHTPLVSTPSFANPWGGSKQWFGNRISTGIKGVQKISAAPATNTSGLFRYQIKSNKVRKIEVN